MGQESFYGGKPGFSFIIVKNFSSVEEMINDFKQGPNYNTVHFDEHVLINTKNKNDPDNGKIYRRGYNYTEKDSNGKDTGGAIYVGTIVGPSGRAPILKFDTVDNVDNYKNEPNVSYGNSEDVVGEEWKGYMLPGRTYTEYGEEIYNDKVEWSYASFRDENNEDAIAYIGFKIPYPVIDFSAESVNPYYEKAITNEETGEFVNTNLAVRTDDESHPFYEKWHFNIPRGIKGDAFKNLRVMTADSSIEDYVGKEDDIKNKRKVLVYDYYKYNKEEEGEFVTIYAGDYNMITDINVTKDGVVTINYDHDDSFISALTLVNNAFIQTRKNNDSNEELGTGDQRLYIQYSDGTSKAIGEPINYIMESTISKNGQLLIYYSDPNKRGSIEYNGKNGWINVGAVKSDSGVLIGLNISKADYPDVDFEYQSNVIDLLNTEYPNGLEGIDLQGKIISIGETSGNKELYAFDYSISDDKYKGWYFLGKIEVQYDLEWTSV
jgi:hypothetical protein